MKKILYKMFDLIFIICFTGVIIGTIFNNKSLVTNETSLIMILCGIAGTLLSLIVYVFIKKNNISLKKEIIIAITLFTLIVFLQVLCIQFLKSSPAWDWKDVYESARAYVKEDFEEVDQGYFQEFENNHGILFVEIFIFKVINKLGILDRSLGIMVYINLICVDFAIILIYLTLRKLKDNKAAIFGMVLSLFTIPFYTYLPIFYTDTFSIMFPIGMLYFYVSIEKSKIKKNKIIYAILLGIFAACGMKIKFTCAIMLIAIIIDSIMRKKMNEYISKNLIIILTTVVVSAAIGYVTQLVPVFSFDVNNNDKAIPLTHWFMMGLEERPSNNGKMFIGSYSPYSYEYTRSYATTEERKIANIAKIKDKILNEYGIKKYLLFLYNKILFTWSDATYYAPSFLYENPLVHEKNIISSLVYGDTCNHLRRVNIGFHIMMFIGFLLSAIAALKINDSKLSASVCNIGIFGILIFFMFWESSSRYLVNFVPIFLISTVYGYDFITNCMIKKKMKMLEENSDKKVGKNMKTKTENKIISKIKSIFKLIRVKHYVKNILVFLPLIFSANLLNMKALGDTIMAFFAFSLLASTIYVINDIQDVEADKKHPVKCKRPIASGKVKVSEAYVITALLFLSVIAINMLISKNIITWILLIVYFILNLAYSMKLKHVPIIDIVILVSGFLIRVLYGAAVISVPVSNWLYLTIIAISFYLSLGKRRNELIKNGTNSRKVLKFYNKDFLDKNMYMCLALAIVFYSLWCVDPDTIRRFNCNYLVWTVPFIIVICMKYSLNVEGESFGDPTDVILGDKVMMLLILGYGLVMGTIIYLLPIIQK